MVGEGVIQNALLDDLNPGVSLPPNPVRLGEVPVQLNED
jgi:hypothetical protein